MNTPAPATPEGSINITSGDITFILERLLPQRGHEPTDEADLRRMLEERIRKRLKVQVRRRIMTRKIHPLAGQIKNYPIDRVELWVT